MIELPGPRDADASKKSHINEKFENYNSNTIVVMGNGCDDVYHDSSILKTNLQSPVSTPVAL